MAWPPGPNTNQLPCKVASPTLTIGKLTLDSLYLTATLAPFRRVNVERLPPDISTLPLVAVRSVVFGTVSSLNA